MAIPNGVPTAEESRKMINIIARNLAVWPKEWEGRLARRSVEKGGEKNQKSPGAKGVSQQILTKSPSIHSANGWHGRFGLSFP